MLLARRDITEAAVKSKTLNFMMTAPHRAAGGSAPERSHGTQCGRCWPRPPAGGNERRLCGSARRSAVLLLEAKATVDLAVKDGHASLIKAADCVSALIC